MLSAVHSNPCYYWDAWDIATDYFTHQPNYADVVVPWIIDFYHERNRGRLPSHPRIPLIVDVACGSGQLSAPLSKYCSQLIAIDNTPSQLQKALEMNKRPNITYKLLNALQLSEICPKQSVDIIAVGQAAHLFDCDEFYNQAKGCLKPNGVLALVGYTCPGIVHQQQGMDTVFKDSLVATERFAEEKVRDFYRILHVPCDYYRRIETQITIDKTRAEIKGMLRSDRRWYMWLSDFVAINALPLEARFKLILEVFSILTVGSALTTKSQKIR